MPSDRFPGVEALDAFLPHHLAGTPLAHLTPFEYVLQYLELPLDEDHDVDETYELFWGVCCLDDEFEAFAEAQKKKQKRHSEKKQASIAAAVPLPPEETDPEPYYREIAPPHQKHQSVQPIAPAVPAAQLQAQTAAATFDALAHQAKLDAIRVRTRQLEAENIELEKDIALLTARLRFSTLEPSHAETSAGAFGALSGSSSASAGSAFDSVEAKLGTYKATIRGKIQDRYHTVDGIAAKADAFQNTIRARLAKL